MIVALVGYLDLKVVDLRLEFDVVYSYQAVAISMARISVVGNQVSTFEDLIDAVVELLKKQGKKGTPVSMDVVGSARFRYRH
ncbi:hypothetical protein ACLOJK_003943 [Asimina triloba]